MTLDLTAFDAMLMDAHSPRRVENIGYASAKGFALIAKSAPEAVGPTGARKWVQPIGTRLPNQGSSTYSTAMAASGNESRHDAFEVTRSKHYIKVLLDNETILATAEGRPDAFERTMEETRKGFKSEMLWYNFRLYRNRGGAVGRMENTAVNVPVITCRDPADAWGVSTGDVLHLAATDGTSGALRAGSVTVASVQHATSLAQAATITLTGNINAGVGAAAVDDYYFKAGDFGLAPAGFPDYNPDTAAEAATTLFSLDRSVDNRLGGARIDGTGGVPVREVINDMVFAHIAFADDEAGGRKTLFANPLTWGKLSKELDAKWAIVSAPGIDGAKKAAIGVRVLKVDINGVELTVVLDKMFPAYRLRLVDLDMWDCFHAGKAPHFLTERINILQRGTADDWKCEIGGYLNYCTSAPHTGVVGLLK